MMRLRDRVGLNLPPLFLRLMLGVVFIWAGLGKIAGTMAVEGEAAAALANLGVIVASSATPAPQTPKSAEPPPAAEPRQEPEPKTEGSGLRNRPNGNHSAFVRVSQSTPAAQQGFTASDFPKPVSVRKVYGLSLVLQKAAKPRPDAQGGQGWRLWPEALAAGNWPFYLAWGVTLAELVGGVGVLAGFFTRLSALGLAGVMAGAIWLTEIGPAMQSGQTVLGFLPDRPAFDPEAWRSLMLQFALLMSALALAFLGPGRLSLDTLLLGGRAEDEDADDD